MTDCKSLPVRYGSAPFAGCKLLIKQCIMGQCYTVKPGPFISQIRFSRGEWHHTMQGHDTTMLSGAQKAEVRGQLARVLQSEHFRASHRCSRFLEFSVHHVLDGKPIEELKERVIGTEVFQRPADYDTSQDNIVRVTANEVRKRLAMFYEVNRGMANPILHLSPGSYAVSFQWAKDDSVPQLLQSDPSGPATPPVETRPVQAAHWYRIDWRAAVASLLVIGSFVAIIVYRSWRTTDLVQRVWAPILQSPKPALICVPVPFVYGTTADYADPRDVAVPMAMSRKPAQMSYAFVGIGDAYALADTVKVLSAHRKEWQLLTDSSTPSDSLLAGPVIVIGNRSNRWSRGMAENQRFFFDAQNDVIYDRFNPQVKWAVVTPQDWKVNEDYAIVSRFTNPASGQPVIAIAGLTIFGTQAAGNFITNQDLLAMALHGAPKDWEKRDFQFVLHVKVLGNTPERPTLIASYFR